MNVLPVYMRPHLHMLHPTVVSGVAEEPIGPAAMLADTAVQQRASTHTPPLPPSLPVEGTQGQTSPAVQATPCQACQGRSKATSPCAQREEGILPATWQGAAETSAGHGSIMTPFTIDCHTTIIHARTPACFSKGQYNLHQTNINMYK